MTSLDSFRVVSAFDGLVEHLHSIELSSFDTFPVSENMLPAFKTLLQQYADQHSRTKKDIASLRSTWTCLASVAANILSQAAPESSGSATFPSVSLMPDAALDAVADVASGHSELENSRQLFAQVQKQLQDVTQYEAQNEDVYTGNERPSLQMSKFEADPSPSSSNATFAKCSAGIASGKKRRDEQYLRNVFNHHKDSSGGLSGQNLIQAFFDADAPIIPTSDEEVADVIKQFDANSNGVLEFGEFQSAVNYPDELQLWLSEKQLPLATDALRSLVGRGSDQLKKMSQLSPADIDHAAAATCASIPSLLNELHQELQSAFAIQSQVEADMKADPSKFNDFYKMACGTIADFHKGLTGRVGMPHLNFKNAMRQEHCERAGCNVEFTTGNYTITTTPKLEWQYIVESVPCPDMGHERRIIPISELLQLAISETAKLCEEEVIAIILYTGPMFQIYNTILRQYPADKFAIFNDGDNLFSTTIFVLVSAIQKLSRFTRIPLGTLLYRGLGGKVDFPDIFFQIDDKGCSGYAEWGFLSTTSHRDVALGYSGVIQRRPKAMVMVIETSSIDRGADISEFSQYPGEKEFLFLPCSFIQRIRLGNGRVQVVDGGLVAFFPVKVNMNIKTQTVEELQEQKKSLHMVSARSMLAEVKFELTDWMVSDDHQEADVTKFCDDVMSSCRKVVEKHERADTKDFADDETYRRMINEVLDTKADAKKSRLLFETAKFRAICLATLIEHSDFVLSVIFHPTAPIMVTGSRDHTAKVWRLSSEKSPALCILTLTGHTGNVSSSAVHPTAPIIVTGSHDNTAKLWCMSSNFSSATCAATLLGHSNCVHSVAFHPTLHLLATASDDNTARLWRISFEPTSASCVALLEGHSKWVRSVAFHSTAPLLATGSSDNSAKLWLISSKKNIFSNQLSATCFVTLAHSHWVDSVAFHPTALILATGSGDKTAKLWRISLDQASATCLASLEGHSSWVRAVAFHPTAPLLATGSYDMTAKLWLISPDQSSATCVATLAEHTSAVVSVAFHPTAPLLATGSDDNTAKLWR
jgi:WD40 repeat protein